jgi:PAS domain S-box-containing protein
VNPPLLGVVMLHPLARSRAVGILVGAIVLLLQLEAEASPRLESVKKEYLVRVWETDRADLPHYCFTTIGQTPDGYLWLGSFANVSRFDGMRFTIFDHEATRDLPGNSVRTLLVDHQGVLWAGTDQGIARLKDGHWQIFGESQGCPGGVIGSFADDRHGNFWASVGERIIRWEGDHFVPFPAPERGDKSPLGCWVDADGKFWANSERYLGVFRDGAWAAVPLAADEVIAGVTPSREGGLWVAEAGRIRKFKDGQWTRTIECPKEFRESVVCLMEDSRTNLWLGGYTKGVLGFMKDGSLLRCTTEDGLENNATLCLFEDSEGHIWIGSNGGGLARLRPRTVVTYDDTLGLPQNIVNSVAEAAPGQFLVGTHGGGLVRLGAERFGPAVANSNAPVVPGSKALRGNSWVHSVVRDASGTIWAGTYGDGLFRIQGDASEPVPLAKAGDTTVNALFVDSKDRLWVGTEAGLYCRDRDQTIFFGTNAGLPAMKVRMIAEDDTGGIWAGNGRTLLAHQAGERFVPFQPPGTNEFTPYAIYTSREGSLWIGTASQQLARLHQGKLFMYSEQHGLPDVGVTSILEDNAGDMWFGTGGGIVRISRASLDGVAAGTQSRLDCMLFDKSDGMRSTVCRDGFQPASFKSADGRLWFATLKGASVVDPRNVRVKSVPTRARIEQVKVDDKAVVPLLTGQTPHLTIPPGSKRVEIRYTGINLDSAEDIEFEYRREDLGNQWVRADSERVVRLYDLHPGEYELTVRAMNKEKVWSPVETGVAFTVQPFFWQTAWFGVLALLGLVGGVGGTVWRIQSTRNQRAWERRDQERELAEERAQSAALTKAKEALEEALERFEGVIENAPLIAILGFDQDGVIHHWNAASQALYGFSRLEAVGQRVQDLLLAEGGVQEFEAGLREVWTMGMATEPREWAAHTRSGEERHLYSSMFPVSRAGKTIEVFRMDLDITERKQLEDRLRQAQKMEAVGQLAGGVAHDFNNILTVIQGHLGLLAAGLLGPSEIAGSLKELTAMSERAANLTRQLLAFSRRQVLRVKPLDLDETLETLSKMLRRLLGEHIALACHHTPGSAWVNADAGMMEQVVINLAVNARDAMPKGGQLTIATAVVQVDEDYARRNAEARIGKFVCLSVADNGSGMDATTARRIFEPFFTTKAVGKGTGLGLATVYGIVKQHQGWIEVESILGTGSTFKVFLPACAAPAPEKPIAAVAAVRGGNETILVVEDEAPVRQLVGDCLRRYGYKALEAGDGQEALALWQQHREEIALIMTDMVMPGGMTGKELAAKLKAEKRDLKVIYSSGYSLEMTSGDLRLEDDASYLAKPYEPSKLAAAIRRSLDNQ